NSLHNARPISRNICFAEKQIDMEVVSKLAWSIMTKAGAFDPGAFCYVMGIMNNLCRSEEIVHDPHHITKGSRIQCSCFRHDTPSQFRYYLHIYLFLRKTDVSRDRTSVV